MQKHSLLLLRGVEGGFTVREAKFSQTFQYVQCCALQHELKELKQRKKFGYRCPIIGLPRGWTDTLWTNIYNTNFQIEGVHRHLVKSLGIPLVVREHVLAIHKSVFFFLKVMRRRVEILAAQPGAHVPYCGSFINPLKISLEEYEVLSCCNLCLKNTQGNIASRDLRTKAVFCVSLFLP